MVYGYHHLWVKMDQCDTNTSSWPVFGAMLYQKTASWGEIWVFSATDFMVQWCLSMIPLLLGWYTDLKYRLTLHFSHSSFWTETYTVIYQSLFYWPPLQKHLLKNSLYLFHCLCSDSLPYCYSPRSTVNHR